MKLLISLIVLVISLMHCAGNSKQAENQVTRVVPTVTEIGNETDTICSTRLLDAVMRNDTLEAIRILQNGCDVNTKLIIGYSYYAGDSTYQTPLSNSPSFRMSLLLLESGADPNIELGDYSPLELATILHDNKRVELLLKHKADVNHFNKFTNYQNALIAAISTGNIEALEMLISNGAEFKAYANNIHDPIHKAIQHNQYEIARYLLSKGLDARVKVTPVNHEGEFGDCVPCPFGIEPIHSAVVLSDMLLAKKFINLLVEYNADVDAKNNDGITPLGYIAASGDAEIAEHLISHGAKVSGSAIIQAAAYQNIDCLL